MADDDGMRCDKICVRTKRFLEEQGAATAPPFICTIIREDDVQLECAVPSLPALIELFREMTPNQFALFAARDEPSDDLSAMLEPAASDTLH
jgi:hypothetical protein